MMAFGALLVGMALGIAGTYAWVQSRLDLLKAQHAKKDAEGWAEVARLRAQVARLVGAEKPPPDNVIEFPRHAA